MGNYLNNVALLLIFLWCLGHFAFSNFGIGDSINLLLVIASFALMLRFIRGDRVA